jgi:hypothetical protein
VPPHDAAHYESRSERFTSLCVNRRVIEFASVVLPSFVSLLGVSFASAPRSNLVDVARMTHKLISSRCVTNARVRKLECAN